MSDYPENARSDHADGPPRQPQFFGAVIGLQNWQLEELEPYSLRFTEEDEWYRQLRQYKKISPYSRRTRY